MAWGTFFKTKLAACLPSTTAKVANVIGFSGSFVADAISATIKALGKQSSFTVDAALSLAPTGLMALAMTIGCIKPCGESGEQGKKIGASLLLTFLYLVGRSALNLVMAHYTDYSSKNPQEINNVELGVNLAEGGLELVYLLITSCPGFLESFCEHLSSTPDIESGMQNPSSSGDRSNYVPSDRTQLLPG